ADGAAIANARVQFNSGGLTATADTAGNYSIRVPAGTYTVYGTYSYGGLDVSSYPLASMFAVSGDATQNFTVDDVKLDGRILDQAGAAVASAYVTAYVSSSFYAGLNRGSLLLSAANGRFSLRVPKGNYQYEASIRPPNGSTSYAATTIAPINLTADASIDFQLHAGFLIAGTLTKGDGTAIANASLQFWDGSNVYASTNASGQYSVRLSASTYTVYATYGYAGANAYSYPV